MLKRMILAQILYTLLQFYLAEIGKDSTFALKLTTNFTNLNYETV